MRTLIIGLLGFSVSLFSQAEVEYWKIAFQPVSVESDVSAQQLDALSSAARQPLRPSIVLLADMTGKLSAVSAEQSVLVAVPPSLYYTALDLGWVPILRYQRDLAVGMYRLPGTQERPIERLGTPPRASTAALIASSFLSQPVPTVAYDTHTDCIRGVVISEIDACVAGTFFVQQYAERFELQLEQVGKVRLIPPVVFFGSPGLPAQVGQRLQEQPIQIGDFTAVAFDTVKDSRRFSQYERQLRPEP